VTGEMAYDTLLATVIYSIGVQVINVSLMLGGLEAKDICDSTTQKISFFNGSVTAPTHGILAISVLGSGF
jgi:hypothetical protein